MKLNASIYAKALYEHLPSAERASVIICLDALSDLVRQKGQVVQKLSSTQFSQLLDHVSELPTTVRPIITLLHQSGDIMSLPRLATAFRRQLHYHNILLTEITVAEKNVDTSVLTNALPKESLLVQHADPMLIAGARMSVGNSAYEFTVEDQLEQIHAMLTGS